MKKKTARRKTLYEMIEANNGASIDKVEAAIKKKFRETHPDMHVKAPEDVREFVKRCFQCVNSIRDILCDPVRRRVYNTLLTNHGRFHRSGLSTDFCKLNQRINRIIHKYKYESEDDC